VKTLNVIVLAVMAVLLLLSYLDGYNIVI